MTNLNPAKDVRIAVIGFRYNPQLGTYITGPYVGRIARVNKNSFSVKFDNDIDNEYRPKSFNFYGNARQNTNCLYGSMRYEAHSLDETKKILEREIAKYDPECLKAKSLKETLDKLQTI